MSLYRRFHDRFGTAGVVLGVIALILALGGTALAASGKLTSKQKKEVEKIAKKYAGKDGAPGATGPAGAPGKDGTNGAAGADGKSVTSASATAGECNGVAGGVKYTLEGNTTKICNGKDGTTGFTETLPQGKTETGGWSYGRMNFSEFTRITVPVSFSIPLSEPIPAGSAHFINAENKELVLNESFEVEEVTSTACLGTAAEPTAAQGHFCMYTASLSSEPNPPTLLSSSSIFPAGSPSLTPFAEDAGSTGATGARLMLVFTSAGYSEGWGTWAVTAP